MLKRSSFWFLIFTFIFILSQDYYFWGEATSLGWLGLPYWVYRFILLQLVLVAAIYFFCQNFWLNSYPSDSSDIKSELDHE